MFTLVRDGMALMGNNEDFVEPGYVWFVPPAEGRLGRINFGFKGDRFVQGSMNEKGLCFDAAVTADIAWQPDPAKKDTENLLELIMDTCATVDEAETLFRTYNCKHLAGYNNTTPFPPVHSHTHVMAADGRVWETGCGCNF